MSNKTFSFQVQLKLGEKGESFFIQCYKDRSAKKSEIKDYDIIVDGDKKVELKTDSYSEEETGNFFMERWSDVENSKEGGPWQSHNKGTDYFVYFYIKNKTFYWFKTKELMDFIEKNKDSFPQRTVKNYGWQAVGYLVPREMCEKIWIKVDKF